MAAPKPPHIVDCPPPRPDISRAQSTYTRAPEKQKPSSRRVLCVTSLISVAFLALLAGAIVVGVRLTPKDLTGDPVFSVAVAGVAGLDPARDVVSAGGDGSGRPLSPVFNLTFHIDNTGNSEYDACVPGLSTATVSYGDAFLAKGSVPPFCAKGKQESEPTAARAWGDAVVVPRFLRDELAGELAAGEAEVDVKVTMPRYCTTYWCHDRVLSCKAKIGGGASPPCRLDYAWTHDHSQDDD